VIIVAGNEVEITFVRGSGTEIGALEMVVVAAAAVVLTEIGSDFASAGRPAKAKVTLRATPIRRCITSASAPGGRKAQSRGTVIAGGRIAEVGIVSMSPGRAETTTGAREVRDTKEGTHDDMFVSQHLAVVVHLVSSFETNRTYWVTTRTLYRSHFATRLYCWC
jgi:hypothetical protein